MLFSKKLGTREGGKKKESIQLKMRNFPATRNSSTPCAWRTTTTNVERANLETTSEGRRCRHLTVVTQVFPQSWDNDFQFISFFFFHYSLKVLVDMGILLLFPNKVIEFVFAILCNFSLLLLQLPWCAILELKENSRAACYCKGLQNSFFFVLQFPFA